MIRAIQAVQSFQDKQWVPEELRDNIFFGHWVVWMYHAVLDDRTCELCQHYAEGATILGNYIRASFPYLEILDENTIALNVHPNCRCWLERA